MITTDKIVAGFDLQGKYWITSDGKGKPKMGLDGKDHELRDGAHYGTRKSILILLLSGKN